MWSIIAHLLARRSGNGRYRSIPFIAGVVLQQSEKPVAHAVAQNIIASLYFSDTVRKKQPLVWLTLGGVSKLYKNASALGSRLAVRIIVSRHRIIGQWQQRVCSLVSHNLVRCQVALQDGIAESKIRAVCERGYKQPHALCQILRHFLSVSRASGGQKRYHLPHPMVERFWACSVSAIPLARRNLSAGRDG
jgi:hypothetical protein